MTPKYTNPSYTRVAPIHRKWFTLLGHSLSISKPMRQCKTYVLAIETEVI